jgi:protein involved in polysaccharide export with SLBB domain
MRSCLLFLGAMFAVVFQPAASAQNLIPNKNRGNTPAIEEPVVAVPASRSSGGVLVSVNSQLSPGDEVSIQIEEDNEAPWKTYISDTGHVELSQLGSVKVAGMTATSAAAAVRDYLLDRYYHKATVRFQILRKAEGATRRDKAIFDGKVNRPGKQEWTDASTLTLSEGITAAGTTMYSDLRKVKLTRGGATTEHDVEAIIKKGRTDLDVRLRDGDRIYVPAVGVKFFGN